MEWNPHRGLEGAYRGGNLLSCYRLRALLPPLKDFRLLAC